VRVLVVDDEFLVVLFVSSMLEDLGCEVETALHGNEALGKLADDPRIKLLIVSTCLVYPDTRWPSAPSECDLG
jgi:CheY-like chemotaxis protein